MTGWNRIIKFIFGLALATYVALAFGFDTATTKRIDALLSYLMGDEPRFIEGEELDAVLAEYGTWCFADSFNSPCEWAETHRPDGEGRLRSRFFAALPARGFGPEARPQLAAFDTAMRRDGDQICGQPAFQNVVISTREDLKTPATADEWRPATAEEAEDLRFALRRQFGDDLCHRVAGFGMPLLLTEYHLHPLSGGQAFGAPEKFYASSTGALLTIANP